MILIEGEICFVLFLIASEEVLFARADAVPEETRTGTHYDEEGMTRRLQEFNARHDESQGFPPLVNFFRNRGSEVLTVSAEKTEDQVCKEIEQFVEKACFNIIVHLK